jgi:hypothetical protein
MDGDTITSKDECLVSTASDKNTGIMADQTSPEVATTTAGAGWFQSLPNVLYRIGMLFTFTMIAWNAYRYLNDTQDAMHPQGERREALLSAGVEMQRPSALQALFGADPGAEIPVFPGVDPATGKAITAHRPIWPSRGRFDLLVYASPASSFSGGTREKAQLVLNANAF